MGYMYKTVLMMSIKNALYRQDLSTENFHRVVSLFYYRSAYRLLQLKSKKYIVHSSTFLFIIVEQTDLKINDVVGLELYLEGGMEGGRGNRDISHPQLYGTVNIYLVHSHDLFLRDTIDAKGHQGVKGDTGK